jgi:hypothetical protein
VSQALFVGRKRLPVVSFLPRLPSRLPAGWFLLRRQLQRRWIARRRSRRILRVLFQPSLQLFNASQQPKDDIAIARHHFDAALAVLTADPASATYVKMKGNACARVGMSIAILFSNTLGTTPTWQGHLALGRNSAHGCGTNGTS